MPELAHLLKKLRDRGPHSPVHALARLVVAQELDRPLQDVLAAPELARLVRHGMKDWDVEKLKAGAAAEFQRTLSAWESLGGTTKEHLPGAVPAAIQAQLGKPMKLEAPLVMALIDQPAVRALIRDVLQVTLMTFVRKVSLPLADSKLFSGVMSKATSLAKGASGMFSAVSSGLEQEAERRVKEFLDEAMSTILQRAVAHICDPAHAESYAALAAGVVESGMRLAPGQWAQQVRHAQAPERGTALLLAARAWMGSADFQAWLAQVLAVAVHGRERLSVRGWLDGMGLAAAVEETAVAALTPRLQAVLAGDGFAAWLAALLEEEVPAPAKRTRRKKE